ncbi:MAG: SLC45 family MFS transporter [Thermotogota bacterium]
MKFKSWKLFVLGFGFFGVSIIWPLYNAYVPIFLKSFDLSSFWVGTVMTFDNIFAILMLPVIGAMSDQTRTKFGRRKPYIMVGAPFAALFFVLIPIIKDLSILPLLMFIIILMNFFMAVFRSPVVALMPDVTPSKFRSQANGVINFMGGLGALLAFFAGKPLYDANQSFPFIAGAIIMLGAVMVLLTFIKEDPKYTIKETTIEKKAGFFKNGLVELMGNLKDAFTNKEKSLLFMLLSILFWFIGFNAIETFFTTYAKFHAGIPESTGALIMGVFSLVFMVFAIPSGFIGAKIGRKKTIYIGLVMLSTVIIVTYILGNSDILNTPDIFRNILFVLFAFGGMGWALINVNALPMVVDMTTNEKSGGYTGLYYFFSMAANIFAPPLAGLSMDILDYNTLMIFSFLFFILAFVTLQFVKRGERQEQE